jgi:hypothetical protein
MLVAFKVLCKLALQISTSAAGYQSWELGAWTWQKEWAWF